MRKMQKRQAGFTILEIGIVMVILISLVIAFSSALWEKQTASDIQLIQTFFEKNVPDAMASCRVRRNNVLTGMDRAGFIDCSGIAPNVVGIPWTFSAVANGLTTMTMDLGSMSENVDIGAALNTNLTTGNYGHIVVASTGYSGTLLTVVVRAR